MCGIVSIFNIKEQTQELRQKALRMSQKIRHRGPDWSGICCKGSAILAHERLSIVDPESGKQPLFSPDGCQVLAVNGEIYNHKDIRQHFAGSYEFQTGSDCEVILALYREMMAKTSEPTCADITAMIEQLSGIFAFALYDSERLPKAVSRKYPSPLGPKPTPGVQTTPTEYSILSKNFQLGMLSGVFTHR